MQSIPLASLMPADGAMTGWSSSGDAQSFDKETLFRYADGGSEFFFLYGFEQMAVRSYVHHSGEQMDVEIWRLATPDDAYGLFSQSGAETSVQMGKAPDAALDSGTLLCFWQDRYYVLLRTAQVVADSDLIAFAQAISSVLPAGGTHPALIDLMPSDSKPEGPIIFFREEMVIQDRLYLGGNNVLGLSQKTRAVLTQYRVGEETIKVILVEYPDANSAASAGKALQNGGVKTLLASKVTSNYLAAAFGNAAGDQAGGLLEAIAIP